MSMATGTQQNTPTQEFFIQTNANGRWQADFNTNAQQVAYIHRRHADGTIDTIKAEPKFDEWLELGGIGARDVAVGRI